MILLDTTWHWARLIKTAQTVVYIQYQRGMIMSAKLMAALMAVASLTMSVQASADIDLPITEPLPVVPGTVETRSQPFITWYLDLSVDGYVEDEYAISGSANLYSYVDEASGSPEVSIDTPDQPYTTRLLVRRPIDTGRFNGTVYVEVLNATAGWDGDPIWQSTSEYLIRSGAVWVGLSTKPNTVNFLRDSWGRGIWPARNAERYATLSMPAFGQVWDMLTQVGALLKTPAASGNPLAGYDVQRLIMVGYSQSAAYQVTYANSFHESARMADGRPVYDGYYVSAGGARAKHALGPPGAVENIPLNDARNLIDVAAPVIRFQTQTEVVNFPSYPTRQADADYPWLRTYEMAGGSHVDSHLAVIGGQALVRDLGLPPSFCPSPAIPFNPIRIGYVQSALMQALDRWIQTGAPPPASRFLQLDTSGASPVLARDADGNAIGGIRPPDVRVPLGNYVEANSGPGFCGLFGGFDPFNAGVLQSRYRNHGSYVNQYQQAVQAVVHEGFLLKADADALRKAAAQSAVGK